MAQQHGQAQREQLPGEAVARELCLDLAQPAALSEHERRETPLLGLRETRCVDMAEQVGAVAVVVVVRNHHADLVQRGGPAELAHGLARLVVVGRGRLQRGVQPQRQRLHARRLRRVDVEALLQRERRVVAQVAPLDGAVPRRDALLQLEDDAMAQRAARRLQCRDAEVGHQRVEHGEAAAEHGAAVFLQPGEGEPVDATGAQALLDAPTQAVCGDGAVADAVGHQQLRHRSRRARRAERFLPVHRRERFERLFQLGAGGDLRGAERRFAEAAVAEPAHRQADAADLERLGAHRGAAAAEDHLGGAPADVDDEARPVRGLQPRDAGVDQPRLLAAGDHLDRQAERAARACEKGVAVARFAQRLRRDGAHALRREASQPLREPRQAIEAALHRFLAEHAVGVEPGAEPNRLLQVVDAAVQALVDLADLEAKAVRAEVDGGQRFGPRARRGGGGGRRHALHCAGRRRAVRAARGP